MFARKTLLSLALAGLSAGAFAQQSTEGKTDIFGRPYVNQTNTEVYFESDPYAPLPQIEQMRREQREAEAAAAGSVNTAATIGKTDIFGRAQLNLTANEIYFSADPFDPLPQLQPLYTASLNAGPTQVAAASADARKDIFGRPYTGVSAEEVLYESDPLTPLPQFWGRATNGLGAVAATQGPTKSASEVVVHNKG